MPSSDLDEQELYVVVRRAVRDGVWDVLGTIAMLLFAGLLFLFGATFAASGIQEGTGPTSWLPVAFGVVLMALAVVYVLRDLDLLPFRG